MKLLLFFLLLSCVDNSPFDEDFWDTDEGRSTTQRQQEEDSSNFTADLFSTSTIPITDGLGKLDFIGNSVTLQFVMKGVPSSVVATEAVFSTLACSTFAVTAPAVSQSEGKDITHTETGTIGSLFRNAVSGSAVNGLSFVVYGYARGATATAPASFVPLACGTLQAVQEEEVPTTTTTGTGGTSTATTGTTGQTIGGTTLGGVTTTGGITGGITTTGGVTGVPPLPSSTNGTQTGVTTTGGVSGGLNGATVGGLTGTL
jgi:hypothetical protein